tara:strand:- start:370 stop:1038 length:669 start_codon:yes stop_codon:yes gene_type:complete
MSSESLPIRKIEKISNLSLDEWKEVQYSYYSPTPPYDMAVRKVVFQEIYALILKHTNNVWITGGTLLGAIRDKVFLPWDDDVDLDLIENDFVRIMYPLKQCLMENGFIVRLTDNTEWPKMVAYKSEVKIAIGSLKESGKLLLRPAYKQPKSFFVEKKIIQFANIDVNVPNPPEKYLEYVYGHDWRTPKVVEDDVQLYTTKYLRRPKIKVYLKRLYLTARKYY